MQTIRVTGPESSGKTTLARRLAWCLDGIYVAEAARAYLHARRGSYTDDDLPAIWEAQRQLEETALAERPSYLICDTGPEVIHVWSEVKYGHVARSVREAVASRQYDVTLLCAPDLPWVPDPLRETPDLKQRWELFERYRVLLPGATVITGPDRVAQALRRSLAP